MLEIVAMLPMNIEEKKERRFVNFWKNIYLYLISSKTVKKNF